MNFEQLSLAHMTLLLKKDEVTSIRDFRPITLLYSFTKLIIKLLANRLEGRVLPNQGTLIKGWFIQDNFRLVASDLQHLGSEVP